MFTIANINSCSLTHAVNYLNQCETILYKSAKESTLYDWQLIFADDSEFQYSFWKQHMFPTYFCNESNEILYPGDSRYKTVIKRYELFLNNNSCGICFGLDLSTKILRQFPDSINQYNFFPYGYNNKFPYQSDEYTNSIVNRTNYYFEQMHLIQPVNNSKAWLYDTPSYFDTFLSKLNDDGFDGYMLVSTINEQGNLTSWLNYIDYIRTNAISIYGTYITPIQINDYNMCIFIDF